MPRSLDFFDEEEDEPRGRQPDYYPGSDIDLNSRPLLGDIAGVFDEMGWKTYRDAVGNVDLRFASNREREYDRPAGLYPDLDDAIMEAYGRGIARFTDFYLGSDGFWHFYVYGS